MLAIAGLALALSIYALLREPDGSAARASECVDPEARAELARLRRALADRDAFIARLTRTLPAPGPGGAVAGGSAPPQPARPAETGPRRYKHFEIPNPAVTVTQKDDGTYDIRTSDPALAGTVILVTAVTQSGDEDQLYLQIP